MECELLSVTRYGDVDVAIATWEHRGASYTTVTRWYGMGDRFVRAIVFRRSEWMKLLRTKFRSVRRGHRLMVKRDYRDLPSIEAPSGAGPGESYCNPAVRIRSSRRFVCFSQSGGMEI